jgi:galactonate dehydratase
VKIIDIKPFLVDRCLLVRIYTDEGIVGNGEAGLWAYHKTVFHAIQELSEYYVGKDPMRMEHHFQVVSRSTHFMGAVLAAAMSAVDIAMWDILGKSLNQPVYQLLGGKCRDKIKIFANVGGNTLDQRAESAIQGMERGFTSLRTTPFFSGFEQQTSTRVIKTAVEIVKTIREAVGDEIDLGLEIHRNLTPDEAIILAGELAPYRILYYEDPIAPQSEDALEYVARHVNIPIAVGERSYNIYQYKELIDRGVVSMIRPDLSVAGGFTQVKKIAAIAEAAFVGIFPHLMGSPVNVAAFAQLDAAIPNYALQEGANTNTHPLNEIVDQPLTLENGHIIVPDRPGIGIEIREDRLAKFPYRPNPIAGNFHADGSVAH